MLSAQSLPIAKERRHLNGFLVCELPVFVLKPPGYSDMRFCTTQVTSLHNSTVASQVASQKLNVQFSAVLPVVALQIEYSNV